jgi:hypothetical protein
MWRFSVLIFLWREARKNRARFVTCQGAAPGVQVLSFHSGLGDVIVKTLKTYILWRLSVELLSFNILYEVLHFSLSDQYSFDPDPAFLAKYRTGSDPDLIRIQGFDNQKTKKITSEKKFGD